MPRRNRTGPNGEGPLTGWGCGECERPLERGILGPLGLESHGDSGGGRRRRFRLGPPGRFSESWTSNRRWRRDHETRLRTRAFTPSGAISRD